jgi:DEAD/DEAH box helicase domain-containing protein
MRAITFDIESISNSAVQRRVDVTEQELTVIAIHDSSTDAYTSYVREELPQLWPILESADLLIGFNSEAFDIPLLNRYYPGDLTKIPSLDLLLEVQKALGRRLRLQSLAEATLGEGKSGDGLQAMEWWREGKTDLVREYCIKDVKLTRELYDYAMKHGKLLYRDLNKLKDMKIDTSLWERGMGKKTPAMTHALQL